MAQPSPTVLDATKLFNNALTSIRLGIEDFELSQKVRENGGDPARALSAVRNLFAGVLLLFKFKLATCATDPAAAAQLIFMPPEIHPQGDGEGGVKWLPSGKFKPTTIDVGTIEKRFRAFAIEVDWPVIRKLQACRNDLEHLHPANTLGEVADFVSELFPVLWDFIQTQLQLSPTALLGEAWESMLNHHQFVESMAEQCRVGWAQAGIPERMQAWLEESYCEECGSTLVAPHPDSLKAGLQVESDTEDFEYLCLCCSHSGLISERMLEALSDAHYYDPSDGEDPPLEECEACGIYAFLTHDQSCQWCGAGLTYSQCVICFTGLGQDDQRNHGLCSYHANVAAKD